jgi:hypothetical protein
MTRGSRHVVRVDSDPEDVRQHTVGIVRVAFGGLRIRFARGRRSCGFRGWPSFMVNTAGGSLSGGTVRT